MSDESFDGVSWSVLATVDEQSTDKHKRQNFKGDIGKPQCSETRCGVHIMYSLRRLSRCSLSKVRGSCVRPLNFGPNS
jgi:hypothetical protein